MLEPSIPELQALPRRPSMAMQGAYAGGHNGSATQWRDLLATMRRFWWFLVLGPVLTVGAIGWYLWEEPPEYRAAAMVRLGDARRALTVGLDGQPVDPTRAADQLMSQVQLLRSRVLVGNVVDSVGLRLEPDFRRFPAELLQAVHVDPDAPPDTLLLEFSADSFEVRHADGDVPGAYGQPFRLGGLTFTIAAQPSRRRARWIVLARNEAIDRVLEDLKVVRRPLTNVVDVSYTTSRPAVAQQVVNTIVQTFQGYSARGARDQSHRRRLFLEEQLRRTDSLLTRAQFALSAFRSRQQVYSAREKLVAQQKDLLDLQTRREGLDADRTMYRSLLDRLQSADPQERQLGLRMLASSPEVSANPLVSQTYWQLVRLQTARDSALTGATATNPDVRRIEALIAATETQLVSALRSHLGSLEARIGAVDGQVRKSAADLRTLPAAEAEEVRLVQEVETFRKMGDQLRDEHQRAQITEAVEVGEVELVDLADRPYKPVPGMYLLKLAGALLLGLALGGAGAVAVDQVNTSIRRRDELEGTLHLPSLAIIPKVSGELNQTLGAEAFRVLRTNLRYSPDARRLHTVVVTSTAPGEGKTTTAINLAVALAHEGQRILLIDGDVWHGRLHVAFGGRVAPGLTECLLKQKTADEAIQETGHAGLFVMPRGNRGGARDLIGTGSAQELLRDLAGRFDLVVLDTPPVLGAADAAILGALADGVVLVVRAGKTDRAAVREAARQLSLVGARLVGTVLNDPGGISERYGDYYYAYGRQVVEQ